MRFLGRSPECNEWTGKTAVNSELANGFKEQFLLTKGRMESPLCIGVVTIAPRRVGLRTRDMAKRLKHVEAGRMHNEHLALCVRR